MVKNDLFILGEDPSPYIEAIHNDPLLRKEQHPTLPLTIANAGKGLHTPKAKHQLFAKGIVYNHETFELVSLPLVKFYNHFELEGFQVHPEAFDEIVVSKKYDGSMIQVFHYNDEMIVTSRGSFTSDHAQCALDMIQTDYARHLPNLSAYPRMTFVFELIHPEFRNAIDYGGSENLTLIAMRNNKHHLYIHDRYFPVYWPDYSEYRVFHDLGEALEYSSKDDGEGCVISFSTNHKITHRLKLKTDEYIALYKLIKNCTVGSVFRSMMSQDNFTDWEAFRDQNSIPEELEDQFRYHFDTVTDFYRKSRMKHQLIDTAIGMTADLTQKQFAERVKALVEEGERKFWFMARAGRLTTKLIMEKTACW